MDNITDLYDISIVLSNTNLISITTTYTDSIYSNVGTIYVNPFFLFDPIALLAWLMIFVAVGAMIQKPTTFIIAWIGCAVTGMFNIAPVYAQWILFLLITGLVMYKAFLYFMEHRR